eukprot:CAMPEP_0197232806 /NCGR_PEP_ID=MMETSP1429-20130617/1044_1 /TAXON_ID=49237 /ORGANISM="Chaetoceros  sp., Strain UNC1202" /LENGTH=266 /DNA_ID=CAMNT_0042690943 /DNA_START=74 /DNA_END=874 /DNA_ORIENTATION=-
MTTPMAEDTPLMRARNSYQGNDVEHQGDATFEEVQDTNSARSSKSRLLVAMALLAGFAVAGFSGGLRAGTAQAWGWEGMMPSKHHHHHDGAGGNSTLADYTGPGAYEVKMAAMEQTEAVSEQKIAAVRAEEAKAISKAKAELQAEEAQEATKLLAELSTEVKTMEAEKYSEYQVAAKNLTTTVTTSLNATLKELQAEEDKLVESIETLLKQAKQTKELHAQEQELEVETSMLRSKETGELDAINGVGGGEGHGDEGLQAGGDELYR